MRFQLASHLSPVVALASLAGVGVLAGCANDDGGASAEAAHDQQSIEEALADGGTLAIERELFLEERIVPPPVEVELPSRTIELETMTVDTGGTITAIERTISDTDGELLLTIMQTEDGAEYTRPGGEPVEGIAVPRPVGNDFFEWLDRQYQWGDPGLRVEADDMGERAGTSTLHGMESVIFEVESSRGAPVRTVHELVEDALFYRIEQYETRDGEEVLVQESTVLDIEVVPGGE